jgi:hypothetical protein
MIGSRAIVFIGGLLVNADKLPPSLSLIVGDDSSVGSKRVISPASAD